MPLQIAGAELFNLDEFGNATKVGDGSVPAGLEDKAGSRNPIARKSQLRD